MSSLMLSENPPAEDKEEGQPTVGKEFARFLRANNQVISSVFMEEVLARNAKLERDNQELWRLVWNQYSPEELRKTVMLYNRKRFGYECTCFFCAKSAFPMLFPINHANRDCQINFFVKTAIARAGLIFLPQRSLGVGETRPKPIQLDGLGKFHQEPCHLVFGDLDDMYSIGYGLKVLDAVGKVDSIVFAKLQCLFRMLRERQHYTFAAPN